MRQSDDASTHDHTGLLVISLVILFLMFAPLGCAEPAAAKANGTPPVWELALITWYENVPPKKNIFDFPNLKQCYDFQVYLEDEMDLLRIEHPKFGAIVGECNERT